MNNKSSRICKKGLFVLLLALVMVLSFAATALADSATLKIVNEQSSPHFTLGSYTVDFDSGDTVWDIVESVFIDKGIDYDYSSGYLSSVNGLAEQYAPSYAGWMFAVNDIIPSVSMDGIAAADGDDILLYYSTDLSIPGTASGSGEVTDSSDFAFNKGKFLVEAAPGGSLLTLYIMEGSSYVRLNSVPNPESLEVDISDSSYNSYTLDEDIPVSAGDVLGISVGSWGADGYAYYNINIAEISIDAVLESIAKTYTTAATDPWKIIDMMAYQQYNPEGSQLSAATRQNYINSAIALAAESGKSEGDYAKAALALQSLGIDISELYADGSQNSISLVDRLKSVASPSIYSTPYVLSVFANDNYSGISSNVQSQFELIAAEQGEDYLFSYQWSGTTYSSPDLTGDILTAVNRYTGADSHGVQAEAIANKAAYINALSLEQGTGGSFGNANTNAMVILGLVASGINPHTDSRFINDGVSLLEALFNDINDSFDGFLFFGNTNALATEQAFRALIAAAEILENDAAYNIYDFSGNSFQPGFATSSSQYTLTFTIRDADGNTVTDDASIRLKDSNGKTISSSGAGKYQLSAGNYTYTVSLKDHVSKSGSLTVLADDTVNIRLERVGIEVSFRLIGDHSHGTSGHSNYFTWRATRDYVIPEDSTVEDLIITALKDAGLSYTLRNGYLSAVENPLTGKKLAEMDNGANSGWLYVVNRVESSKGISQYVLEDGDRVIVFFSDDYTKSYSGFSVADIDPDSSSLKKELKSLIKKAEDLLAKTIQANSAEGLANGEYWATAAAFNKLETAIKAAQSAYDDKKADEQDYYDAIEDLQQAIDNFDKARQLVGAALSFYDVPASHWAYSYITALSQRGVINGYGNGYFGVNDAIRRGDFVLMLWRLSNESLPTANAKFSDVSLNDANAAAITWAANANIINGYSDGRFGPQDYISRQDIATMLYRYALYKGIILPQSYTAASFADYGLISDYARTAVNAMQQAGIINGMGNNLFSPTATASRAQTAKMMYLLDALD